MLMLYHFPGAICAQKVRVALAEKGLYWESRSVLRELRSPDYLRLNPHGYVPTLVHDGQILTESRIISEYIESAFDGPSLLPKSPFHRAQVGLWTKQIDDGLHLSVYVLTFASFYRPRVLRLPSEQVNKSLPLSNPIKRSYTLDLIANGFESQYFPAAVGRFRTLLSDMESTLSRSEWLVGGEYTLADADFAPYLRRLEELGVWELAKVYPNVARWFAQVQARPSYKTAILAWVVPEDEKQEKINAAIAKPHLADAWVASEDSLSPERKPRTN
jgi:glutathione S-transferase